MELWTDEQLINEYQQRNDPECIAELYQRYRLLILGIGYQILEDTQEAEDLLSDVFIKLISHKSPILHMRNWLFTAAKHLAIDKKRKRDRYRQNIQQAISEQPVSALHTIKEESGESLKLGIKKALAHLPHFQQQCLELFFLHEKSYKEIHALTGIPLNKIKSHIQNGKRRLKLYLGRS